jgi:hypothetical protein
MYTTFDEFLKATYDVNAVYMDMLSGDQIIFQYVPGYCNPPCKHIINGIRCNGTPVKINKISKSENFENIICSFPSRSDEYENRFIPIKSSNNRW